MGCSGFWKKIKIFFIKEQTVENPSSSLTDIMSSQRPVFNKGFLIKQTNPNKAIFAGMDD